MKINEILTEAKSAHPQQAAKAIAMKKAGIKPKNESTELEEEFDLIESIIERLAEHNGVDAEVIWEDLETLTEDELYAFAVTSEPIMESQGMAEGSEQKPSITYKDYTLQYDYQTEDTDPEGYSTATTYYFDVLKDGNRVGDAEYFDYFGDLTIRINGKTKKFEHRHPLASQVSELVSSLPDNQKRDLSDPKVESQGMAESSLNEVTQGVEHSEWVDNVRDAYPGVKIIKKRTEDGRHIKSQAILNGQLVGQYNMNTGVGTFKAPKQQGVAEDWQKANKRDKTDGMSQKAVNAYRRENPGSKLKTAVTTKPSKLKKGGKASKRRKSYCSRSRGQMKMHSISCAKTPDKAICKARRRWNC